jgi:uncharacterized membrane protein (UPF0127 family)
MHNKNIATKLSVILLSCSFLFTNLECKKENDSVKVDSTKDKKYKIQFVKQGEVYFQDKNKNLIKVIDVELAETSEKRETGLMYRDNIEESQGMLFLFEKEEPQAFWMKNTIMPLDIIYINSKKEIVKIFKNTTPFSKEDLPSIKPILYVVEVKAGFTDKYNVKEGNLIDWRRD